jgi:hypothetical protein
VLTARVSTGRTKFLQVLTYLLLLCRVTQRNTLLSSALHHETHAKQYQNKKTNHAAMFHLRACSTSPTTVARWAMAGGGSCSGVRAAAAGRNTQRQG